MNTEIIKIDGNNINKRKIRYGADMIREGHIVAFPTETVYGLGANAFDGEAVRNIFKVKGRPLDNPLIIHLSDLGEIDGLILGRPPGFDLLVEKFWPGPLTLILKRSGLVPHHISAGLDTVAIRIPAHPVALALIKECGFPLAAPSANLSGKPSTTLAEHVYEDLKGKIPLIIDSGPCEVGLESTVLDLTSEKPIILRPGKVTVKDLQPILGDHIMNFPQGNITTVKSPGVKYKHYSPNAPLIIVQGNWEEVCAKIKDLCKESLEQGKKPGILATSQTFKFYTDLGVPVIHLGDRNSPEEMAAVLFDSLRKMDDFPVDIIYGEGLPLEGIGYSIMNRLTKAAHNIIILK